GGAEPGGEEVAEASGGLLAGALAPGEAVLGPHEGVVGVADLVAAAHEEAPGARRMAGDALSPDDAPAGVDDPQREVGVLAVGAGEALVEPGDGLEDFAAVGHVGGDPPGPLERGDAALGV